MAGGSIRVALITIPTSQSARSVPLGPAMLAATLRERFAGRVETALVDLHPALPEQEMHDRIVSTGADWVGFSLFCWNRERVLGLGLRLRQARPQTTIVLGGPEATADRGRLDLLPWVDLVVPGEAEETFAALIEVALEGATIGRLREIARQSTPPDPALLPSPWLDGTLDPGMWEGAVWELSRGCPFRCAYCYESRGGSGVRRFPEDRLRSELALFRRKGVRQVFVLDPTFNHDPERAAGLLAMMAGAPGIRFDLECRAEAVDARLARLLGSIDVSVQIGLQSSDPAVLALVNRSIDPGRFRRKVLLLHRAGVVYGFDLIVGLPGDSLRGFRRSLDFALGMAPNHLDIFDLSVLPGTRLADKAGRYGLVHLPESPYTIVSTPTFGPADLAAARRLANRADLFYNRGRAVPWFLFIAASLHVRPSTLLDEFGAWLERRGGEGACDVVRLHAAFLIDIFERRGGDRVAGLVAADIAVWFGLTARLLEDALPSVSASSGRWRLGPGAALATFRHDPLTLLEQLEAGATTVADLRPVRLGSDRTVLLHAAGGECETILLTRSQAVLLRAVERGNARLPTAGKLGRFAGECLARGIIEDAREARGA